MKRINKTVCALIVGAGVAMTGLAATGPAGAESVKLRTTHKAAGQSHAIGGISAGFHLNCAAGFSKAGQKKSANGWTDWYVCTTPVITCPTQLQDNGHKSSVHPKAIVQQTGGNPDGGTVKFRIQYQCDYSWVATPEG